MFQKRNTYRITIVVIMGRIADGLNEMAGDGPLALRARVTLYCAAWRRAQPSRQRRLGPCG
jgi:hypothetical protein